MLGKGDPILLFNGASDGMDAVGPVLSKESFFKSHSNCVLVVDLEIQQWVPNHILYNN